MAKLPEGYVKGVEARNDAFFQMLEGEDDLGMIVRAHIHVEHELREFILAAAPNPKEIKFSDFDFAKTLQLALALGLNPELKAGLTALGTLRNKFAHRLDMKLTDQHAKDLWATFTSELKADMRKAYASARQKHLHTGRPPDMMKTTPKDLIAMCALMLRGGVLLEHATRWRKALFKDGK